MSKINWTQAKKDYLCDSTLSYQDIADKYEVSKKQVALHAKKERWSESRKKVNDLGFLKFFQEQAEHIAQANKEHLLHYRQLLRLLRYAMDKLEKESKQKQFDNIPKLYQLVKASSVVIEGERKIMGLNYEEDQQTKNMTLTELFTAAEKENEVFRKRVRASV